MAQITLHGNIIETVGDLPEINTPLLPFKLTKTDFSDCTEKDFQDKNLVLNIFPSIDTPVCATSVRRFNQALNELKDTVVLCISADLPFAHKRFCEGEGLKNVIPLSVFRYPEFGLQYGVTIKTGVLAGILSRAVLISDTTGKIVYVEHVPEIGQEPDYSSAIARVF